jgi:gluconate 2-dehydrogenase gamma chain
MSDLQSRRIFLRAVAAASAAWATVDVLQVEEALAYSAQHAAHGGTKAKAAVSILTHDQAAAIDAMTTRILPSVDGRPGAHEAGVVAFVDKSLGTFHAEAKPLYLEGIQDLNRRAAQKSAGATFAALTAAQQDDILREIEQTPFFQTVRFDTIIGTFALPTWGGNHDYAGWRMLGFEHQPAFQPPFGFYDAEATKKG